MTDSPQCFDIDDSASGCEFHDHGAAGDQCFGGDSLFVAIRGSAARPVCSPRPQRAMRAMEQLLKDRPGFEPRCRCFVPRITASGEEQ